MGDGKGFQVSDLVEFFSLSLFVSDINFSCFQAFLLVAIGIAFMVLYNVKIFYYYFFISFRHFCSKVLLLC